MVGPSSAVDNVPRRKHRSKARIVHSPRSFMGKEYGFPFSFCLVEGNCVAVSVGSRPTRGWTINSSRSVIHLRYSTSLTPPSVFFSPSTSFKLLRLSNPRLFRMTSFQQALNALVAPLASVIDSAVDTESQRAAMEAELLSVARPFFREIKRKYPDLLLFEHKHARGDRGSCKLVGDYGLCFPEYVYPLQLQQKNLKIFACSLRRSHFHII